MSSDISPERRQKIREFQQKHIQRAREALAAGACHTGACPVRKPINAQSVMDFAKQGAYDSK